MADTLESLNTQLTSVRTAITTIEGGAQAFTVLGRTYQRGELRTLYDREKELLGRIAQLERGGIRMRLGRPVSW